VRTRGAELLNVWEEVEGDEEEGEEVVVEEGGAAAAPPAAASQPATRKGPGGVLDVCGHLSHNQDAGDVISTSCMAVAHDPPASRHMALITAAAGAADPSTALPLHPRHPRFTGHSLQPVYLGTITNKVVYGLGIVWQGGSGRE
jgi:hypothetical protein